MDEAIRRADMKSRKSSFFDDETRLSELRAPLSRDSPNDLGFSPIPRISRSPATILLGICSVATQFGLIAISKTSSGTFAFAVFAPILPVSHQRPTSFRELPAGDRGLISSGQSATARTPRVRTFCIPGTRACDASSIRSGACDYPCE